MSNRERFEAWFKKEHPFGNLEKSSNGGYKYIPAMVGWEAWQAALASQEQQDLTICTDGGKCGAGGYCITCHNVPAPEGGDT